MEITQYQNQQPEKIAALSSEEFQQLLKGKIYKINPKFNQSQKCVRKLVESIKVMEVHRESIKLMKDLIKFYQVPILIFFEDFYKNINLKLISLQNDETIKADKKQKIRNKLILSLQQISQICSLIMSHSEKCEFLSFFTQYGASEKQVQLQKSQPEYQKKYLKFLSNCLKEQKQMLNPNVDSQKKVSFISSMDAYLNFLTKDRKNFYLQKIAVEEIIVKVEGSIQKKQVNKFHPRNQIFYPVNQIQGNFLNDLFMQDLKNVSPCCRTFFFQNQPINQPQTQNLEYKNYKYPYDTYCYNNLRRAICGFLNRAGGVIMVGIYEGDDKKKEVKGQILSENKKQDVLRQFRYICTEVFPDIVSNHKYCVKFVPIKQKTGKFIPGKYVVKVHISPGDTKLMYSYNEMNGKHINEKIAFRTANQVLRRQIGQQILKKYKQKLLNPTKYPPIHQRPCPQPDAGQQITYQVLDKNSLPRQYINAQSYEGQHHIKRDLSPSKNRGNRYVEKNQPESNNYPMKQERKQKSPDLVYVNIKRTNFQQLKTKQTKQIEQTTKNKQKSGFQTNFACDADDQEQIKRKQKLRQSLQNISVIHDKQRKKSSQIEPEEEQPQLDFKSLNPTNGRQPLSKKSFNPTNFQKKYSSHQYQAIEQTNSKPSSQQFQPYQVSVLQQRHIRPINKTENLQLLVAGFPYEHVKRIVHKMEISLDQQAIECHHKNVTWLKIRTDIVSNGQKVRLLAKHIILQHEKLNQPSPIPLKIRKVYKNLIFDDEILLNKLARMFNNNYDFMDEKEFYHYKCKNSFESIQGYIIGLEMKCRIKFISDEELKQNKLDCLKRKAESKV